MCSSRDASESPVDAVQVHCPKCDQIMLYSTRIAVQCHDSYSYHKSCCVNCLFMEMDDCCFEITEEVLATIDDYVEFKLNNKSSLAQEATDYAIVNYLEHALRSEVTIIKLADNPHQVTNPFPREHCPSCAAHSCDARQSSPGFDTESINPAGPEDPRHLANDNLSPLSNIKKDSSEGSSKQDTADSIEQTEPGASSRSDD